MQTSLVLQTPLMRKLAQATTPKQTKKIESIAAAAQAWAKEEDDYKTYVEATLTYVLARRKTTELIQPYIQHGGNRQGNETVTLMDKTGFTKMQWHRRMKELEVPLNQVEEYFHECIASGWHPSLAGVMRYARQGVLAPATTSRAAFDVGELYSEFMKNRQNYPEHYRQGVKDFAEFLMARKG